MQVERGLIFWLQSIKVRVHGSLNFVARLFALAIAGDFRDGFWRATLF
jgi:hypothetical protein